jgi:PAS domain-containing protein
MPFGAPVQWPGDSLIAEPPQIRALRVLTQHPVPVIAVADDGVILFANTAFADVVGCSCDALTSISYADICSFLPTDETLFAVTRLCPDTIGRLLQLGHATLFVKMRRSAIVSDADSGPITLLEGLVERLSRLAEPRGAPRLRRAPDATDGTISG